MFIDYFFLSVTHILWSGVQLYRTLSSGCWFVCWDVFSLPWLYIGTQEQIPKCPARNSSFQWGLQESMHATSASGSSATHLIVGFMPFKEEFLLCDWFSLGTVGHTPAMLHRMQMWQCYCVDPCVSHLYCPLLIKL